MRITNKLMAESIRENIRRAMVDLHKTQQEISTGKKVHRLSDDPIAAGRILDYNTVLGRLDQFKKNVEFGIGFSQATESALDTLTTLLNRAKELAQSQSTQTANAQTRQVTAQEVWNIYKEIIRLGNTRFQNRYIFSGFKSDTPAFSEEPIDPLHPEYHPKYPYIVTYEGDNNAFQIHIGEEQDLQINLTGDEVFMGIGIGGIDIFKTIRRLALAMEDNDHVAIGERLDELTSAIDQVSLERAKVGARINRLQRTQDLLLDLSNHTTELLSTIRDVDISDAMTRLATQQTLYQASLSAGARIMGSNLLDFLR